MIEGHDANQFDGLAGIVHGPVPDFPHTGGAQLEVDAAPFAHGLENAGHHLAGQGLVQCLGLIALALE